MKKTAILILLTCASALAFAHGGGTDSRGCHTESKTGLYHCH